MLPPETIATKTEAAIFSLLNSSPPPGFYNPKTGVGWDPRTLRRISPPQGRHAGGRKLSPEEMAMFDNLRKWWKSQKSGKRPARKNPLRQWSFQPMLERLEDRWVPSAPTVTGVSPSSGPTWGETEVAITGSGFTGATAVKFAGGSASFTVVSDTLIDAGSPSTTSAGVVDVTVTNGSGTSATSSADQFTYALQPTTTSLSSSENPSAYRGELSFTATVSNAGSYSGPTPSGTVAFMDGGTELGTGTLWDGETTY